MKLLALLPLFLLAPEPEVAAGAFRFWSPREGPQHWNSDGVRIDIAPAPCATPPRTEGCRFDPQNNQAAITVTATGQPAFHVLGDRAASYYRVAVLRLARGDARPAIVIENDSGGSSGDVREQLLLPDGAGYRIAWLPERWGVLQGSLAPRLADMSGDGRIDFVLEDGRFAYAFGCGACTPRPPRVFTLRGGVPVDVSTEPAYAAVYRKDMARLLPICTSHRADRNGACAAYVADAARIGRFAPAWRLMLRHHEREPARRASAADPDAAMPFPERLRAFLRKTGYIS
jgi:hypothetical protein